MSIEEVSGLQDIMISMYSHDKKLSYYSKATLSYKGYKIEVPIKSYATLDEAVEGLKKRVIEAALDFNI